MRKQPDRQRSRIRDRLEAMRSRAEKSTSWRVPVAYLLRLVNREGEVPVRARLTREDLVFLAEAREEVTLLANAALQILDLHHPKPSGGLSSDPDNPLRRCRACMTRWPCPTFRAVAHTLDP
ncbi:hypothetical protein [Actinocorallia sp. A-T 12471]|uniref:hypothetical protein n=1 Tax=Actinocorallia sp. A-T 12471 TaxID=3089813 RepID=UPI0029CC3860|nr:hypothetical protein [Actinocorallia sp. A-T 12471]MDX6742080.1 hypothetical protein [Actinocorallia sp. A-T 12471]